MSDMVLNERGDDHHHEYEPGGRGLSLALGPAQTHKSTGKGRFAHRKHQKSKSLCTLETNLDEVGEDDEDPAMLKRVPSVHELRVTKSLQKLNVPDWFKQSSLSKSSSCLLKYGSSSTMNSFSFSPSLISSPCASTAPPAPNVVIKTRVVPPSNPRIIRSPNFTSPTTVDRKPSAPPVKLPSDRLREKEKNKNLMPIPIVPFSQIRAMFEKKAKAGEEKKHPAGEEDKHAEQRRETKARPEKTPVVSKPAVVPSISISAEDGEVHGEEPPTVKRPLFQKPPISPTKTSSPPPPVAQETFKITASAPVSAPAPTVSRPSHRATNGVSDDVDGNVVSPSPAPVPVITRPDSFPPPTTTGRPRPVLDKPPISPTSAESRSWRDDKTSRKQAPKDSADKEPKSPPPKDAKQQFSPSRSLRQFFGRSKDKSSDKKSGSEGGGGSLDSSFSSGDGYYEKEPRRLGGSGSARRSQPTTSTSFERRSDLDSSFSSGEGSGLGPRSGALDTSSRSREDAPSRTSSRTPQSNFPASGGSWSSYPNSEQQPRHQPPFSRFAPEEDSPVETSRTTPKVSDGSGVVSAGGNLRYHHTRLPAAGTSFGHSSFSSENGEYVPESSAASASSSPREADSSATAVGEKKNVKETTV